MEAISVPVGADPARLDGMGGPWPGWSGMGSLLPPAFQLMRPGSPAAAPALRRRRQPIDLPNRSRSTALSNASTRSAAGAWRSSPCWTPDVRHSRIRRLGDARRCGTTRTPSASVMVIEQTSASQDTSSEHGAMASRRMALVPDPAAPVGRQTFARVKLVDDRGRPAVLTHDRVAAHPADHEQASEDGRDGEQQPRVVAHGLGRDVGLDRQERSSERRPVLSTGQLDVPRRERRVSHDRHCPIVVAEIVERVGVRAGTRHVAQVAVQSEPGGPGGHVLDLELAEGHVIRLFRRPDDQDRDQRQHDQPHHHDRGQPASPAVQGGVGPAGAGESKIDRRHRGQMLAGLNPA